MELLIKPLVVQSALCSRLSLTASSSSCPSSGPHVRSPTSSSLPPTVCSCCGFSSCRRPAGTAASASACGASGSVSWISAQIGSCAHLPSPGEPRGCGSWLLAGPGHDLQNKIKSATFSFYCQITLASLQIGKGDVSYLLQISSFHPFLHLNQILHPRLYISSSIPRS